MIRKEIFENRVKFTFREKTTSTDETKNVGFAYMSLSIA